MDHHRRVFTLAAIDIMRGLAEQGKSAAEIADVIGSTAASVRVKCCQLKIKLKRRGRPAILGTQPRRIQEQMLIVYMRRADYAALRQKAADMGKSAVELAGMLLQAIVSSDIYEAVLDEGA